MSAAKASAASTASLTVEQLDEVARKLSSRAHPDDRDDLRQEIWLKYLRYPPRTFGGAFVIGRHVVASFYRGRQREQRYFRCFPEGPRSGNFGIWRTGDDENASDWVPELSYDDSHIFTLIALNELRAAAPKEFARFLWLWSTGGMTIPMLTRVHLHRLRKRIIRRAHTSERELEEQVIARPGPQ